MPDDDFAKKLASLVPAGGNKIPSDIRMRINEKFAEIEAARERGVSWQQIADLMAADGLRDLNGNKPTQSTVRALFHKEKYARGGKQKKPRGSKSAPAATRASAALPCPAPTAKLPEPVTVPEDGPARWMANANNQLKQRCR